MPAAKHIERQVAVTVVIAVEEPAFLMAVKRIVGGVEVEDDLIGRCRMRLQEQIDQQRLDRRPLMADLVVTGGDLARQFEPVQRRFACRRRAILAPGFELARQDRHQRIVTKLVVIVEVLVAERDAEHALTDERGDRVFNEPWIPSVAETSREPSNHIQRPVRSAQKQAARVGRQRPTVEIGHHRPAFDPSKSTRFRATLRLHRAASPYRQKSLSQNNFCLIRRPDALPSVRNAG